VVEAGRTGRKGKSGFYLYEEGEKSEKVDPSVYALFSSGAQRQTMPASDMVERCVLAMVNEAAHCLDEGILRSPRDGDVGAVFGLGFPPFLGGPFRWVDAQGVAAVVRRLNGLHARFTPRFAPAARLVTLADQGGRFYPAKGKPVG
jgi:3-hydroxyacyl-CoA dehydrogenase/enoyl-CoA hydratase/3-hydroxybutyryl-CoA epimerase